MSSRSIIHRLSNQTTHDQLDSLREDQILEDWVNQRKMDDVDIFIARQGEYPPTSRLSDFVVLIKEFGIDKYRLDCLAYWRKSGWKLIEVKEESKLGPSVIGDLLVKGELFKREYTVNPSRIERIILSERIPNDFEEIVEQLNRKYNMDITLRELDG